MKNNPQLKKTEHEKTLGLFDLAFLASAPYRNQFWS